MKITNNIILNTLMKHFEKLNSDKTFYQNGVKVNNYFDKKSLNTLMLNVDFALPETEQKINMDLKFTLDSALKLKNVQYCYPAREFVLSDELCDFNCRYGYRYPLPFITVLYKDEGITIVFDDDKEDKNIHLVKTEKQFYISLEYQNIEKVIRVLIYFHSNDWHDGFKFYKEWFQKKSGQDNNMNEFLKGCFHIRRYFFYEELCTNAIYKGNQYRFTEQYLSDVQEMGGIDIALLFDYAYSPDGIRCGNKNPVRFLKNLDRLNYQIKSLKEKYRLLIFVYFDPYLIQKGSELSKNYIGILPILNEDGSFHYIWDNSQWHPCLNEQTWRKECADYLKKVIAKIYTDGIYFDEIGKGEQFICFNKAHAHKIPLNQNRVEDEFVEYIKKIISNKLYMCEFFTVDSNLKNYQALLSDSKSILDICHFAFPNKKIFRVINCDFPLGNNEWEINKIFFNGIGLWLDNDFLNSKWYPDNIKKIIRKHYKIQKKYGYIFDSMEIEPLVKIESDYILSNKFSSENETIWTFINTCSDSKCGYLRSKETNNEIYDIYNSEKCEKLNINGKVYIKIQLKGHGVGCIYQYAYD